jgi:hypothetical protein
MNSNGLAKNYGYLSAEERWRLIMAAIARGDETEQDRLVNAARQISLTTNDHVPFGLAFDELQLLVFMELLEWSAEYLEVLRQAAAAEPASAIEAGHGPISGEAADEEEDTDLDPSGAEAGNVEPTTADRLFALALAAGFILKTKADGWKLFCQRMTIPPFAFWEGLPGFARLNRALARAQEAAFVPEGFLRWLNDVRPAGQPELTDVPLTVEGVADAIEKRYRESISRLGGPVQVFALEVDS